ncbi:MAG: FkbM family methyltransferase [Betaproteobacteria bacterium]|nr:FkbM family methyltransferase [Betaproteobacteria bacterium]
MSSLLTRLRRRLLREAGVHYRRSYAQCGEDMIVRFVFDALGVDRPFFLDLGAHHPTYLSNTYALYRGGSRGVNVDASPAAIAAFRRARPRDVNLNVGVGPEAAELVFYEMSEPTLSTFSEAQARRYEADGNAKVTGTRRVPVRTFRELVDEHCERPPDFVSLDVEGLDVAILKSIDFATCRPTVFCVETLTYSSRRQGDRIGEIDDLMVGAGYMRYADTHVNTIYVLETAWRER